MSYKVLGPAWEADLSCPAKLVLISLADQADAACGVSPGSMG